MVDNDGDRLAAGHGGKSDPRVNFGKLLQTIPSIAITAQNPMFVLFSCSSPNSS
jgi:hypothetical protein